MRFLPAFFACGLMLSAADQGPKADLSLKSIEGQRVQLRDYRGKIVVLNFWATWCAPCRAEMPMLNHVEKDYAPKGVVFLAASVDDRKSKKTLPTFLREYNIDFSVWLDATMRDLLRLGMGQAIPATAVLDQDGHIVFRVRGPLREEELRDRLEWLIGHRTTPAPQWIVTH